jgi:hypothetical protein
VRGNGYKEKKWRPATLRAKMVRQKGEAQKTVRERWRDNVGARYLDEGGIKRRRIS